ncbi:MAG: hypothetical protein RL672_336 [Actinomycetota bacterium]
MIQRANHISNKTPFMRVMAGGAAATLLSLALAGCSAGGSILPGGGDSQSPTPTVNYVTAPLTGVKFVDGTAEAAALASPSVACKIDNSEAARPQQGLNSTDVVFDEMVEGGLTRLVAIWQSNKPTAIGPVRSIRPMDPDIISPFGGIVCYSGGQQIFVNLMRNTAVFNASETSEQGKGTFSRTHDREAPHNVIVNVSKLAAAHSDIAAPQQMWDFSAEVAGSSAGSAASAASVTSLTVKYPSATAKWDWSASAKSSTGVDGAWVRTQDGKPHIDKLTGAQVRATNVVVLDVKIDRSYADHKYGHIPKTVMIASGDAWVFTGGGMVKARWQKTSQTGRILLTDSAGAAITLAPGNTWVELKPAAPEGSLAMVTKSVGGGSASPSPSATK